MGAGDRVGAEDDLQPGYRERLLEGGERLRHRLAHLLESLFRVATDPEEAFLVLEVVAEDEVDVRVVVEAALGQKLERFPIEQSTVLHRRATGPRGTLPALRPMRMHDGSQAACTRLTADRVELLLAQRRSAPYADALRREDLDDVGALLGELIDALPQLVGARVAATDRAQRCEDPGSGQETALDGVAELGVRRGADALHRGDAAHQRDPGILGGVEDRFLRSLFDGAAPELSGPVEVPLDVDVGVDQAGEQGDLVEAVDGFTGCFAGRHDRFDAAVAYDDVAVGQRTAVTIEDVGGPQHSRPGDG